MEPLPPSLTPPRRTHTCCGPCCRPPPPRTHTHTHHTCKPHTHTHTHTTCKPHAHRTHTPHAHHTEIARTKHTHTHTMNTTCTQHTHTCRHRHRHRHRHTHTHHAHTTRTPASLPPLPHPPGEHHIVQAPGRDRPAHVIWLLRVKGGGRTAGLDRTEPARAGRQGGGGLKTH